jgi:hypothetical protein
MVSIALALALLVTPPQKIPPGTVIPIMLNTTLDAARDRPGKKIEGKVMQAVPLLVGGKIDKGSRVIGHVVKVTKKGPTGSSITLMFDSIRNDGRTIPLTGRLLAVASIGAVSEAQSPIEQNSDQDPIDQWTTRQVGGDVVKRGIGKVATPDGLFGTWLEKDSVRVRLTPNPGAGCATGSGYDREQSVWIFSSAACGVYGLPHMTLANSGASSPVGEIVLTSDRNNVEVRSGSGWLLMTLAE